jgi:imidazolonepropionase-like amidohydrolase
MLSVVGRLHREGVRLTLGTDTMNPWMTPGSAAHRELELLVEAGLTPSEALVVGTRNGAEALGILGDVGTVEVGKAADLLVLGSDPTSNVSGVRDLRLVIAAGRVYEPRALRRSR